MLDKKTESLPENGSLSVEIVSSKEYFNDKKGFYPVHVNLSCLAGIKLSDPKGSVYPKSCVIKFFSNKIENKQTADLREALAIIQEMKDFFQPGQLEKDEKEIRNFFGVL